MTYFVDVTVEIAFDSGFATPAAERTWTDVTEWWEAAEGVSITRGRSDEMSEVSPSTLSLTLDNTDGRFTPGRAASPYHPNVKVGRPIRITAAPAGGSPSVRFVGYIDEWPVTWDGTDAYSSVTIQATSRTARLGQASTLSNIIAEEYALDGAVVHYQLDNTSDRLGGPSLTVDGTGPGVDFEGTGLGTDGLSAAQFAGGKYLVAPASESLPAAEGRWYGFYINTTDDAVGIVNLGGVTFRITGAGVVEYAGTSALSGGGAINDGFTHHILALEQVGYQALYVDGVLADDNSIAFVGDQTLTSVTIGAGTSELLGLGLLTPMTGTLAHVAVGVGNITPDRIAAHAAAGRGVSTDLPGERITRYAAFAGVPAAEQSLATGSTPIAPVDTTGKGAVELMQAVATTDGGILYDGRDGTLVYQSRGARYQASTALTLLAGSQEIEADYAPKLDRSALLNDVTASNPEGTTSVRAVDAVSGAEYGAFTENLELLTDDEAALHGAAWWRVNTRAEPTLRTPSLSVNLLSLDAARQAELLAVDVSSLVAVTGLPAQASAAAADYFVEGYAETFTDATYSFTLNVSDAAPWLATWVLDDPERSQLGVSTRLAY